jgi:uncharacterized protein YjbI with pentapeptide repeats
MDEMNNTGPVVSRTETMPELTSGHTGDQEPTLQQLVGQPVNSITPEQLKDPNFWKDVEDKLTKWSNPDAPAANGVNWSGVDKAGADLTDANLNGATLININLGPATSTGGEPKNAKLIRAKLNGAALIQANVAGADFSYASATGATFLKAYVQRSIFTHACLEAQTLREQI